ncbi:MAG: hypothetical protein K2K36_05350, partial [Muribaculaceae bacterium]|nr:hypothetical protein [Muribaculaceae bacterium]
MGKVRLSVFGIALAAAVSANAASWRINPNPGAKAQFLTIAEAMNDINVCDGDTLLLDPGTHTQTTLNRENLTIIGSGYFLDRNTDWTETQATAMQYLTLTKGSTVEGCTVSSLYLTDNCTARRCNVGNLTIQGQAASNILVEGCYATTGISVLMNSILRNNIVISNTYYACLSAGDGSIIENNTVIRPNSIGYGREYAAVSATNSTIRNNVIINTQSGFDANNIPYSAKNCIDFTPGNNNVICNNVMSIPQKYAAVNYTNNI